MATIRELGNKSSICGGFVERGLAIGNIELSIYFCIHVS